MLLVLLCGPLLAAQAPPPPFARAIAIPGAQAPLSHVSLASVEDQDGNGRRELVIGVPDLEAVFVVDPTTGGLVFSVVNVALDATECPPTTPTSVLFGWDVASIGDFDCDGREDLLVGAPLDFSIPVCPAVRTGRAWLVGSASRGILPYTVQPWPPGVGTGVGGQDYYGYAVARAGADYDGDGVEDFLVGQPQLGAAGAPGRVVAQSIFHGPPPQCIGLFWPPAHVFAAPEGTLSLVGGSELGSALATVELNGDGVPEVAAGAPNGRAAGAAQAAGFVRIWDGASIAAGAPALLCELHPGADLPAGLRFGSALARIGDRDGDGVDELAVGAPDPLGALASFVVVYSGASLAQGGSASVLTALEGPAGSCGALELGFALSAVGDYDHDPAATPDLLVGVPDANLAGCVRRGQGAAIAAADTSGAGTLHRRLVPGRASERCGWDVTEIELGRSFAVADPGGLDAHGTPVPPRVFVFDVP
jgi:hypothetical protein